MENTCLQLSELIKKEDSQILGAYLSSLYPVYMTNIARNTFQFHGKPVHVFTELNYNLQHQSFEHLTTKGNNDRLYNIARCERILWIRDILGDACFHQSCDSYRVFPDTSKKKTKNTRYIIWCVKEDYVIILEERQREVMIITAYCIMYDWKRTQLNEKYIKHLKK